MGTTHTHTHSINHVIFKGHPNTKKKKDVISEKG